MIMNEQMKSSKENVVDAYLKNNDIYSSSVGKHAPFDIRGYATYIRDNNIKPSQITPEIGRRFINSRELT